MSIDTDGKALTKNYPVGEGLCECCKLGIAFADGGKTVYMVDREVDDKQNSQSRAAQIDRRRRDLRRAGGNQQRRLASALLSALGSEHRPRQPRPTSRQLVHPRPLGTRSRAFITAYRKTTARAFAPRHLVHANTAPETLYNNLIVGDDDTVYLAWSNLDANNRAQIYMRTLAADGRTWSPIQQISNAKGNASRPVLALQKQSVACRLDGNRRRGLARRHQKRDGGTMKTPIHGSSSMYHSSPLIVTLASIAATLSRRPSIEAAATVRAASLSFDLIILTCALAISAMAATVWASTFIRRRRNSAPVVGAAAIAFDLQTLDGKSVALDTFRGKPLVLNFFASWCDPCRDEMPLINELASAGAKDGYNLLGIAVEDTRAAVTEFAKEVKLVFPIALDLNSTVKRSYRIFGPPATFFIDGQGVIRDVVLGPITPERAREAMKKVGVGR